MLSPPNLYYLLASVAVVVSILVWARYRRSPTFSFFFKVFLLIALGVILLLFHVPYLNDDFARALGHAFIIAAILAATVDLYVKERVLCEVSLDVSKYLVGYRLPEEVQDRIRSLMQSKWIRRGFELRVRFSEVSSGKKLKADIRISAEMQNITSETLPFTHGVGFEKHEPVTIIALECDSEDAASAYRLDGEELKKVTTDHNGQISCAGKTVNIPPVAQSIDHTYRFRSHYEVVQPIAFSEIIAFDHLTIGVVVEITDAPPNYSFRLTPQPDHSSHYRWEYKRLFMPGEHIRISWSPAEHKK